MQPYHIWQRVFVIVSILALLVVSYAQILINNFKTPEKTADFFKNSSTYYYISEIIKANIRNRYTDTLKNNPIELAAADTILNAIVSPNIVERVALPALKVRQRIAKIPLSLVDNNVVLDTAKYTQQFSSTLDSLQLPPVVTDTGKNLIASVPPQITVVDVNKNPNSILASITRTKTIFANIQNILNISWIILLIAILGLILINLRFLRRLIFGLFMLFLITGVVAFILSYAIPTIASSLSSSPDPIAGALKDSMWDSIVSYYFTLTRRLSAIYLFLALGLFLLYRYVPFSGVQGWTNEHLLGDMKKPAQSQPAPQTATTTRKQTTRGRKKKS